MSLITRMRKQTAVYWPLASEESGGLDYNDFGQPQYSTPVEIDCRWDESTVEFIDKNGTRQVSKAIVYCDRDVEIDGVLMLGTLDDITDENDPKENANAWLIKGFDKIPNLRATEYLRMAYL